VKKGTETGLREFLFPVLRESYADLLDAATRPARADLLLLGELNYAGDRGEVTGIPWRVTCWRRFHFSLRSIRRYCAVSQTGASRQGSGMGRAMRRLARFVTRKWPEPIYELRRELGLPKGRTYLRRQALA